MFLACGGGASTAASFDDLDGGHEGVVGSVEATKNKITVQESRLRKIWTGFGHILVAT